MVLDPVSIQFSFQFLPKKNIPMRQKQKHKVKIVAKNEVHVKTILIGAWSLNRILDHSLLYFLSPITKKSFFFVAWQWHCWWCFKNKKIASICFCVKVTGSFFPLPTMIIVNDNNFCHFSVGKILASQKIIKIDTENNEQECCSVSD